MRIMHVMLAPGKDAWRIVVSLAISLVTLMVLYLTLIKFCSIFLSQIYFLAKMPRLNLKTRKVLSKYTFEKVSCRVHLYQKTSPLLVQTKEILYKRSLWQQITQIQETWG